MNRVLMGALTVAVGVVFTSHFAFGGDDKSKRKRPIAARLEDHDARIAELEGRIAAMEGLVQRVDDLDSQLRSLRVEVGQPVPGASANKHKSAGKGTNATLPIHKFRASTRPGKGKSQIRALAKPGTLTQRELEDLAVALAGKHGSASTLVQFFGSQSALEGWDGTGLLRDSDWPHWLCRIAVETNPSGTLYSRTFSLAKDVNTGSERTDVLWRP